MPRITSSILTDFSTDLFKAADVPPGEARVVAESLVSANLKGHDSHGVARLHGYIELVREGLVIPGAKLRVKHETASAVVADGALGFGQVQMVALIDRLLPKAREQGIACGTMQNCGHVGRLCEWVERAAREGVASLLATNDNGVLKCVAPPGGTRPTISTNPVAIGVPTGDGILAVDISTSVVANGKVHVALSSKQQCPPGWLLDSEGQPTTDPAVRFTDPRGSILPLGGEDHGYKGFGLGLLFDMLVGGLTGGFCPPDPEGAPLTNNVLMVAWDPEKFFGQEHFVAQVDELIEFARSSPRKAGVEAIRLPGDRSESTEQQRLADGIPIDDGTWEALIETAGALGVAPPAGG